MIKELVQKNRSYRRFFQDFGVSKETLRELVDCARFSGSGRNLQPLRYILVSDIDKNALVFKHITWAAYLAEWPGPMEGERPSAYIIFLGDKELSQSFGIDQGLSAQSMLLCAVEKGLGGCMIASLQKEGLRQDLNIPEKYDPLMVLALGKPKEEVVVEPMPPDGNVKYWRGTDGIHHVPKRSLDELIINEW
jgi:nitroreductase